MPSPSVIDLCGGGWWNLVPLPSPPHPDRFQVWMFQFAAHRHLLWDSSPGKLFPLPSDAVSQDFSQCRSYFLWTQDIILRKIYCPQQKVGSLVFRKWYCESHVAHSYLSELESDELVSVHILVSLLGAVHPESSHTVCCYTYLALCVDLLCRKYRVTQLVIAFLSFQRKKNSNAQNGSSYLRSGRTERHRSSTGCTQPSRLGLNIGIRHEVLLANRLKNVFRAGDVVKLAECLPSMHKGWMLFPEFHKPSKVVHTGSPIPELGSWRQGDQKFKAIFMYIVSPRPTQDTWDSVLKCMRIGVGLGRRKGVEEE